MTLTFMMCPQAQNFDGLLHILKRIFTEVRDIGVHHNKTNSPCVQYNVRFWKCQGELEEERQQTGERAICCRFHLYGEQANEAAELWPFHQILR